MRLGNRTRAVLAHPKTDAQILFHGELRKDLPPLRHVADAQPGPLLGRTLDQVVPSKVMPPELAGCSPMMHLSSVVLPMPLRPIRHMREPGGDGEIHIPQRVAAAVKLVEGFDCQHAHTPR